MSGGFAPAFVALFSARVNWVWSVGSATGGRALRRAPPAASLVQWANERAWMCQHEQVSPEGRRCVLGESMTQETQGHTRQLQPGGL